MEWSKEKQTPQIDNSQMREERGGATNGRRKIKQSYQRPVVHSYGILRFPAQLLNKVSCFPGQEEPWSTESLLQASCLQTQGSSQLSFPILAPLCCFLWHFAALGSSSDPPCSLLPLPSFSLAWSHSCSFQINPPFPQKPSPNIAYSCSAPAGTRQLETASPGVLSIAHHLAVPCHCCCLFPGSHRSFYKEVFIHN